MAFAGTSDWASTDHSRMRMLSAVNSIGEGQSEFEAALHMNISKGWHSYWHHPGDSGAPPIFDWSGSENVENVEVLWQTPKRYEEFGFQTFGYEDDVYFPLLVHLTNPGEPAKLSAKIRTMVCETICIPQNFSLSMDLPKGTGQEAAEQKIIEFEKRRVPVAEETPALRINTMVAGPDALVLTVFSQEGLSEADAFVTSGELMFTEIPKLSVEGKDKRKGMLVIPKPADLGNLSTFLEGKELNIVLTNGHMAIERKASF